MENIHTTFVQCKNIDLDNICTISGHCQLQSRRLNDVADTLPLGIHMYAPVCTMCFNVTIGFEKYATGPEILAKTSQNMQVWFGDLNFGTFW